MESIPLHYGQVLRVPTLILGNPEQALSANT